jgi:hypothetical protein
MGYSFRFYGRHPTDWKGAEHPEFSVQFESAPTDEQKVALAQEMIWVAGGGIIDLDRVVWRWSGRFATVSMALRWQRGISHVAAFTDVLMATRQVLPIVDVVFLNALDARGRWDEWSVSQGSPDAGPPGEMALCPAFRRGVDPTLGEPARDPLFDGAWKAELEREDERRLQRWIADKGAGEVSLEPIAADVKALVAAWGIQWPDEVLDALEIPDPPTEWRAIGDGGYQRKRPGDHPVEWGAHPDLPLAHVIADKEQIAGVVFVDTRGESPERQLLQWDPRPRSVAKASRVIATSEDGSLALFAVPEGVYRLVVDEEARLERTWAPTHEHGICFSAGWVGPDRVIATTEKKIVVLDTSTHPATLIAQRANAGKRGTVNVSRTATAEGTLVLTSGWNKPPVVNVFAHDQIKKVGNLPDGVDVVSGPQGQLVFRGPGGVYRLANIDAVVSKKLPKKKKTKKKPRASSKSKADKPPKPILEPLGDGDLPEAEEVVTAKQRAQFPGHARLLPNGDGSVVLGLAPRANDPAPYAATSFPRLFLLELASGEAVEITEWMPEKYYATDGDLSPDGRYAVLTGGFLALRLDLSDRTIEQVWAHGVEFDGTPLDGQVGRGLAARFVSERQVLVLGEKGLATMVRDDDGNWALAHRVKLSKPEQLLYLPECGGCVVQTAGTKRLLAFAVLPTKLKKLFEDKTVAARTIERRGAEVVARDGAGKWWWLAGLIELAAFVRG